MVRMLKMVAPIVPHLAEEVYESVGGEQSSVFLEGWTPETKWTDNSASGQMTALLAMRGSVMGLMEEARQAK